MMLQKSTQKSVLHLVTATVTVIVKRSIHPLSVHVRVREPTGGWAGGPRAGLAPVHPLPRPLPLTASGSAPGKQMFWG